MIEVRGLRKAYKVHKRAPGVAAAFRSLFRRTYESVLAVDGIAFRIEPGERVGFLGPNGAGKTTTLKMLAGLLHPTEGEIRVHGHVPHHREDAFLKSIMLVLGQKQQLIWDLPPSETFELNRAIYEVPDDQYRRTLGELVELLQLEKLLGRPTRQLSLGERMKCELAASLIHSPKVLFLDEPTIGLDVGMQGTIRSFIKQYNERTGATLMLTSHYMEDVEALCPRVLVIDHGQVTFDGKLAELVRTMRPEKRVVLRLEDAGWQGHIPEIGKVVSRDGGQVVLQVASHRVRDAVAEALAAMPVRDLTVEDPPLEEVMGELFARRPKAGDGNDERPAQSLGEHP
jgi:ABC-2 type transport system ATP-binding protein